MEQYLKTFFQGEKRYSYYGIEQVMTEHGRRVQTLPYTLRIVLESLLRKYDGVDVTKDNILDLIRYDAQNPKGEIPFKPSRVILQDFTGVPVVVDLASMREAVVNRGGSPDLINPEIPVDLVVDHSVQVDVFGRPDALDKNMELEFERNNERYQFLKWAEGAFPVPQVGRRGL